jgi:peptidoglycan/LPS O-acetylase OafA/YrhL
MTALLSPTLAGTPAPDAIPTTSVGDRPAESRFVSLDLLRGGAALIVAIAHFIGGFPAYLAVDFFLVLSGFILAHRYLYGRPVDFKKFLAARLARLYPLHLLTLFGFALVYLIRFRSLPDYIDGTAYTFVANLFLVQNVGLTTSELTWNAPSWSISVELWINLVFFACVSRNSPSWLLLLASVAALAVIASFEPSLGVSLPNYFGFVNSGLLRGLASFFLGVVAYRIHRQLSTRGGDAMPVPDTIRAIILAASIALMVVPRPGWERLDFTAPFLFTACIVCYAVDSRRWSRIIKPLSHLGTISYSVYLIHYPILFGMRYLKELAVGLRAEGLWVWVVFNPIASFVLYLCLVLSLAHLTFVWFERPSRAKLRKLLT